MLLLSVCSSAGACSAHPALHGALKWHHLQADEPQDCLVVHAMSCVKGGSMHQGVLCVLTVLASAADLIHPDQQAYAARTGEQHTAVSYICWPHWSRR